MAALNTAEYDETQHKTTCPASYTVTVPAPSVPEVAREVGHTTKAADEPYRLLEFARGRQEKNR